MASWIPNIAFIQDLIDKVRAADANRPLAQLDQRTQYLYDTLQTISSGELLVAKNVTVDASTVPGTPVYFDDATNTFKPALASVNIAAGNNYGFAADSAVVRGVVLVKYASTAGDVALMGKIKNSIYGIDWATVIDAGSITPGIHYLSATAAGQMSRSRSNLSVYIGNLNSAGDMILAPQVNGNLRDHLHYRFNLLATIVADTSTEGWAPVSEFANYPVGATYGYVISKNAALQAVFPPVPIDAFHFEYEGRGVHKNAFVLDADGLWWTGSTPPNALTDDANFPSPAYPKYFVLWLTRLNFGAPFVSTLSPQDDADTIPVAFLDANGLPATSGALQAGIKSSIKMQPGLAEGGLALKALTGVQGQMGPVVGRVFAGTGITLEGDYGDDLDGWYGNIVVTAGSSASLNGDPVLVALDNAVEDFYGSLPALTFPELRVSSVRAKVNVPTVLPANRSMKLILDVIGVASGVVSLNLSYVLVRAGVAINQTEIPLSSLTITRVANQSTRVESDLIAVQAGDTVFYRITQPNAGLATAIPVLRMQYSIVRTP